MIKSEFSERLFETLINHEILKQLGCDIFIPSQVKESKSGLDALFFNKKRRRILALQYKVVNEYIRIPKGLKARAFQFVLHKDKNGYTQHNHLFKNSLNGLNSYYVVPAFVKYNELYGSYRSGILLSKTHVISPGKKINDKKYHYINFDTNSNAYLHSHEKESLQIETLSDLRIIIEECNYWSKDSLLQLFSNNEIRNFENENNKFLREEQLFISYLLNNKIVLFAF